MTPETWMLIREVGAIVLALSAISGFLLLLVKYGIIRPIKQYIDKATIQLTPNAGSHLADAINRTDERVDSLVKGQDRLLDVMMQHLQDHSATKS
jgi:hypothetical protein